MIIHCIGCGKPSPELSRMLPPICEECSDNRPEVRAIVASLPKSRHDQEVLDRLDRIEHMLARVLAPSVAVISPEQAKTVLREMNGQIQAGQIQSVPRSVIAKMYGNDVYGNDVEAFDHSAFQEARQQHANSASLYGRLTDRARKVMQLAQREAREWSGEYVMPEHILYALVSDQGCAALLSSLTRVSADRIKIYISSLLVRGSSPRSYGNLPLTPLSNEVIASAIEHAEKLGANHVGVEHLLLGLLWKGDGNVALVFDEVDLTYEKALQRIERAPSPDKAKILTSAVLAATAEVWKHAVGTKGQIASLRKEEAAACVSVDDFKNITGGMIWTKINENCEIDAVFASRVQRKPGCTCSDDVLSTSGCQCSASITPQMVGAPEGFRVGDGQTYTAAERRIVEVESCDEDAARMGKVNGYAMNIGGEWFDPETLLWIAHDPVEGGKFIGKMSVNQEGWNTIKSPVDGKFYRTQDKNGRPIYEAW